MDPDPQVLGRSQGGFSTKVHLCAEGEGKLLTLLLTPVQWHEAAVFPQIIASGADQRPSRGWSIHVAILWWATGLMTRTVDKRTWKKLTANQNTA